MAVSADKVLVVDVDGTLCPVKKAGENYADLPINTDMLDTLKRYSADGFKIIIQSARNMRSYDGNVGQINKNTLPVLLTWLEKHGVPFDEVHVAKPWAGHQGFYIDDRAVRPDEFIEHGIEELEARVTAARERASRHLTPVPNLPDKDT